MSSIWGSLIYYIYLRQNPDIGVNFHWNYPIVIVGSAFVNYLLYNILELIKKHAQ